MNLLSHSNGLHRIKPRKFSFFEICKRTLIVILGLLIIGFLTQVISNFMSSEKIKANLKYVRIEGKKLEYKIRGTGAYTIVFDGSIGTNIYQWDEICKSLEGNADVKTFVYNRKGYGFSDDGEQRSPSEQAEDLRALLRKAGASEPYIFVGEEYGSLIATNFEMKYPELVAGMVLINPLSEAEITNKEYSKAIKLKYYKSELEFIGSNFYLTTICDKLGIIEKNKIFEENIPNGALEEFNVHKNNKSYRKAVSDEVKNLYKNNSHSQSEGMLKGKPLYIITNNLEEQLKELGEESMTTVYETAVSDSPYAMIDNESVINAINNTVKKVKKIEKSS
ncbi:alpha/beta fold hydrolase [Clostridium uliginosum]|uniref:Alpha/beta hydrolase fold n=1 Tax=Clostridium uliginosum TaxID=119641 RepID=A0A1I1ICY7_9CLOT|nr:alpha/beta hydrolase [Clostridium uliginosum]SFC34116.1 alpha/beta hydrolase fold [Clostridium uliginosum]